jgi:hypothetical protein
MIERAGHRLDAADFAVLRGVLQGMALRDAAIRYWSAELSLPDAKRRYEALRVALLAAARRAGHFGDARALALDMAALPAARTVSGTPRPTFEDFVARVDPEGLLGDVAPHARRRGREHIHKAARRLGRMRHRVLQHIAREGAVTVHPRRATLP